MICNFSNGSIALHGRQGKAFGSQRSKMENWIATYYFFSLQPIWMCSVSRIVGCAVFFPSASGCKKARSPAAWRMGLLLEIWRLSIQYMMVGLWYFSGQALGGGGRVTSLCTFQSDSYAQGPSAHGGILIRVQQTGGLLYAGGQSQNLKLSGSPSLSFCSLEVTFTINAALAWVFMPTSVTWRVSADGEIFHKVLWLPARKNQVQETGRASAFWACCAPGQKRWNVCFFFWMVIYISPHSSQVREIFLPAVYLMWNIWKLKAHSSKWEKQNSKNHSARHAVCNRDEGQLHLPC